MVHKSDNDQVTVVGAGVTLQEAIIAYNALKTEGINISVVDPFTLTIWERHKPVVQLGSPLGISESHRCIGKLPGSYSSTAKSIYTIYICICLHIHHVFVDNFHGKQSSSIHPCWSVANHACEHINILEYTENFWVYTDLGNKGSTNTGEMLDTCTYLHTYICRLLSQSMWGSLRLVPIMQKQHGLHTVFAYSK